DGSTPPPLIDYLVSTLGDRAFFPCGHWEADNDPDTPIENDDSAPSTPDTQACARSRKWLVNAWRAQAGWARDARNGVLMPPAGARVSSRRPAPRTARCAVPPTPPRARPAAATAAAMPAGRCAAPAPSTTIATAATRSTCR